MTVSADARLWARGWHRLLLKGHANDFQPRLVYGVAVCWKVSGRILVDSIDIPVPGAAFTKIHRNFVRLTLWCSS